LPTERALNGAYTIRIDSRNNYHLKTFSFKMVYDLQDVLPGVECMDSYLFGHDRPIFTVVVRIRVFFLNVCDCVYRMI